MKLELRGLKNNYIKTNINDKYEVYHDLVNKNVIIFTPYDSCDTDSICNGISEKPYEHLIEELNNNNNVVIEWSQVEGTTSDYIIYYDVKLTDSQIKSYLKIKDELTKATKSTLDLSYKYNQVKNGLLKAINIDR